MVRSKPVRSYTADASAIRPASTQALSELPRNVCHTSGGSPARSRAASATCTLLPPPPAIAPSITFTFGLAALKAFSNTSKAGCSDGDTHHETTSSLSVGSEKLADCPPPPHAAATNTSARIQWRFIRVLQPGSVRPSDQRG